MKCGEENEIVIGLELRIVSRVACHARIASLRGKDSEDS